MLSIGPLYFGLPLMETHLLAQLQVLEHMSVYLYVYLFLQMSVGHAVSHKDVQCAPVSSLLGLTF
jgi:hypothetical protein